MNPYYSEDLADVYHGDCIDVMRELPDGSVDAVVTDPPYNLSFMGTNWDTHQGKQDSGFCYWLSGLIDGEGCFMIKQHTRGTHAPYFTLKMRADEEGVLKIIQRKFGHGTIAADTGVHPMRRWTVQDKAGCQALVDLLDKYPLRAKKKHDYWAWREAVIEWTGRPRGNRWGGASDNEKMHSLRERLMSTRAYMDIPWSGNAYQDWCRLWAMECLRVLKPGGYLLSFGGTRTYHHVAMAIELAGFEVRDTIAWLFGQGFPKSLDVGKAIDKRLGATREKVGERIVPDATKSRPMFAGMTSDGEGTPTRTIDVTADATPAPRAWHGWGTALKPAFEPCVVARKPLSGSVADNVLTHGTGALNIDATRVAMSDADAAAIDGMGCFGKHKVEAAVYGEYGHTDSHAHPEGRWPTNVALDVAAADELDSQTGDLSDAKPHTLRRRGIGYGSGSTGGDVELGYEDSGGASRFFPAFRYEAKASSAERPKVGGVQHPTVKPLDLMRWLVRLVAPQGATILEPFAGSGTTIEACIAEGMRCIAIEREETYLPLILNRISKPIDVPLPFGI
jgi:site-specific DNA-methyltransferase (adenine-specific)